MIVDDQSSYPNYNMQAAGKLGKINVNVLFMLYQVSLRKQRIEKSNFDSFKDIMLAHES